MTSLGGRQWKRPRWTGGVSDVSEGIWKWTVLIASFTEFVLCRNEAFTYLATTLMWKIRSHRNARTLIVWLSKFRSYTCVQFSFIELHRQAAQPAADKLQDWLTRSQKIRLSMNWNLNELKSHQDSWAIVPWRRKRKRFGFRSLAWRDKMNVK